MRKNLKLVLSLLLLLVATMFVFSCEDESDDTPLDYIMADPDSNGWYDVWNKRSPYNGNENQRIIIPAVDENSGAVDQNGVDAWHSVIEYDDKGQTIREASYSVEDAPNNWVLSSDKYYDIANKTSKIYEGSATDPVATGVQEYEEVDGVQRITKDTTTYTDGGTVSWVTYEYNDKGRETRVEYSNGNKDVYEYDSSTNLLQKHDRYEAGSLNYTETTTIEDGKIVKKVKNYVADTAADVTETYEYDSLGYAYKYTYTEGSYNVAYEYKLGRQGVPESFTCTGSEEGTGKYEYDSKLRLTYIESNYDIKYVQYRTYDKDDFTISRKK